MQKEKSTGGYMRICMRDMNSKRSDYRFFFKKKFGVPRAFVSISFLSYLKMDQIGSTL